MHTRELLSGRIGALAGVAAVVLLFLTVAMVDTPREATDAEVTAWWADSANRMSVLTSTYLLVASSLCCLVFFTSIRAVLQRAEGEAGTGATLVHSAGLVFVVLLLAAAAPRGAVAIATEMGDEPLPGVDLLRYLPQVSGLALGLAAGSAAAFSMAAVSVATFNAGGFGRWFGVVSALCALGTLAFAVLLGPFYMPILWVWLLASSVALWRSTAGATAGAPVRESGALAAR